MASNEVRIIGGRWKGRKLKFPRHPDLRPTLGRVRETLFNWLGNSLIDARALDLFAGSGALGFEALSRGAATVTFVEHSPRVAAGLADNIRLLDANARVVRAPARRFLRGNRDTYDLVFFDPPFDDRRAYALLETVLGEHLTESGLVYVERARADAWPPPGRLVREGRAGDCRFGLIEPD